MAHISRPQSYSRPGSVASGLWHDVYTLAVIPVIVLIAVSWLVLTTLQGGGQINVLTLVAAGLLSWLHLAVGYIVAVAASIVLAVTMYGSSWGERFIGPWFDRLQPLPVVALFPALAAALAGRHASAGAAEFLIAMVMIGGLAPALWRSLQSVPEEVLDVHRVLGITGWRRWQFLLAPALWPGLVQGSIVAWASGWGILIVAESIHSYAPGSADIFGLGSILVQAGAAGQAVTLLAAFSVLVVIIALINVGVWKRLLRQARRYRFE